MKKLASIFLTFCLLVLISPASYAASFPDDHVSTFRLETLNPKMSLSAAIQEYPEILNTFHVVPLSDEEAEQMAASGIRRFVLDDAVSAVEILSSLNVRKTHKNAVSPVIPRRQSRLSAKSSAYGVAWPYTAKTGTTPNCYGYALGISSACNPGDFSQRNYYRTSVSTIKNNIIADMAQSFNGGGRQINTNTTPINSWEWRIATRTGEGIIQSGSQSMYIWDYHFWLQTNTGTWCHKPGQTASVHLGSVTPHTASWNLSSIRNFYNSETVYLALYTGN